MQKTSDDADPPAFEEAEEGGGPVKTFLEHLEDLRWVVIKSALAVAVAMLVCLVAGNKLVAFLTWPLEHARRAVPNPEEVPVLLGTNILAKLATSNVVAVLNTTNPIGSLRLTPTLVGTNILLVAGVDAEQMAFATRSVPILKNYTPLGGIMVALKLGLYGGMILASPFLLYFVGGFVLPALKVREKRILFRAVAFGSVLFFLGVAFCYFVLAGVALMATVEFSRWLGFGADEWRAEEYVTFMFRFMLGMGIGFELPVVILTLVKVGLLDYKALARFRSYAIIGNLVIAAVATPSADPLTMMLMAIPLQFLYEISVWIAWYWHRRDERRAAAGAAV